MKSYQLKITLKSDLCVASGEGFSSSIDTDVIYDDFGIPYIPAKRLKGCLREAAEEYLSSEEIQFIFGVSGKENSGAISISNATIEQYEDACAYLKTELKFSQQKMLELFTSVRAQTSITDEGNADEGSLRFTRVVNHYSPFDTGKELEFFAEVRMEEKSFDKMSNVCKLLRNIGLKRNKGLGAVRCELRESNAKRGFDVPDLPAENEIQVSYVVRLETPLLMISMDGKETEDYIPGRSVYGFFASKCKTDSAFEEMFLKDQVWFSNLYPMRADGEKCIPAPSFIGKVKKTEENQKLIVNKVKKPEISAKSLKSGYVTKNGFWPYTVETEIVYHNNLHPTESLKNGKDVRNVLYTQECLKAGQFFYGTITGKREYIEKLMPILCQEPLQFGRSKTAQYSVCRLVETPKVEKAPDECNKPMHNKATYAYMALSDVVLLDADGGYKESIKQIVELLDVDSKMEIDYSQSALFFKTIGGYNAKWNQKKPQIRVLKKGSSLVFTGEGRMADMVTCGEKTGEGFGQFLLVELENLEPKEINVGNALYDTTFDSGLQMKQLVNREKKKEDRRIKAVRFAKEKRNELIGLNAAFIGRVNLMIEQSSEKNDLENRINTIKTESKKMAVKKLVKAFDSEMGELEFGEYRELIGIVFTFAKYFVKQEGKDNV